MLRADISHPAPEDRMLDAVLEYLQAGDDGKPLDREEWLLRFPELHEQLNTFFENEGCLTSILHPLRALAFASPSTSMEGPIRRPFGRYELIESIGRGGMGIVYKAQQEGIPRPVALKTIRMDGLVSRAAVQRFRNEINSIAALDHPNIIPIFDVGEHEGQLYYTMPLLEGGSLATRPGRWRNDTRGALVVVASIARALHHAHQRGILHRDVKPSNILLDGNQHPFITDFGLAKRANVEHSLTETGAVIGTPGYLAPEQAFGNADEVTTRSDIYGLGAVLYTMLAGKPPFQAPTAWETLRQVRETSPDWLTRNNKHVDEDLQAIVFKCLEKDPGCRYGSAEMLADDIERYLSGEPIHARPIGSIDRIVRWCRRNPLLSGISAVAALLLLFGIAGLATGYVLVSRARDAADQQAGFLRKRVYASDMRRAFGFWQRGDQKAARQLMDTYQTPSAADGQEEMRGFEWDFLTTLLARCPEERLCYRGHSGVVFHATFSPDGNVVASGGEDCSIHLWEASTGKVLGVLQGHTNDVNWLTFSPDGKLLASASDDQTCRLWDLTTLTMAAIIDRGLDFMSCVEFSPDGSYLACGNHEFGVRVWDVRNRQLKGEFRFGAQSVTRLAFSPNGEYLVASKGDDVCCWEFPALQEKWRVQTGNGTFGIDVSSDNRQVRKISLVGAVSTFRLDNGELLSEHQGQVGNGRDIHFSPTSEEVAFCGANCIVRLWSTARDDSFVSFKGHPEEIWSVVYSPDRRRLVTTSSDETVRVWDISHSPPCQLGKDERSERSCVAWSPDSTRLAIRVAHRLADNSMSNRLEIWDHASHGRIDSFEVNGALVLDMTWSQDSQSLFYLMRDGEVWSWDRLTKQRRSETNSLQSLPVSWPPTQPTPRLATGTNPDELVQFGPTGSVVVWNFSKRSQRVDDRLQAQTLVSVQQLSPTITAVVFQPCIRFWDHHIQSWRDEAYPGATSTNITATAISPDGAEIAMALTTGVVKLIDRRTGSDLQSFPAHRVDALAFSPDGKSILSGSSDGSARLWRAESGEELLVFENRREGSISSLSFSPDYSFLAICGSPFLDGSTVSLIPTGVAVQNKNFAAH